MSQADRRALVRQYKERRTAIGVYAIRCDATGQAWVGASNNIDAQANGSFFALRHAGHPNRRLQAAFAEHGEAAFRFEVLERIEDEDLTAIGRSDLLKARTRHWMDSLGAERATG